MVTTLITYMKVESPLSSTFVCLSCVFSTLRSDNVRITRGSPLADRERDTGRSLVVCACRGLCTASRCYRCVCHCGEITCQCGSRYFLSV